MYGQWFVVPTLENYVKQSATINGVSQRMNCISNTFELYTRGLAYHCGLENDLRLESYDTQNEWGP